MINVYDFDKTIYNGDSSVDLYKYALKKKPYIIVLLPLVFVAFILYKLKIRTKEHFKERYFSFLKFFKNKNELIDNFWIINEKKIYSWYLDIKKPDDVIISASPLFLIKPIMNKLGINNVIATDVDINNGKFLSKNCRGEQKVIEFNKAFPNKRINNFYSDSLSDLPLGKVAKRFYIVKNGNFSLYLEHK